MNALDATSIFGTVATVSETAGILSGSLAAPTAASAGPESLTTLIGMLRDLMEPLEDVPEGGVELELELGAPTDLAFRDVALPKLAAAPPDIAQAIVRRMLGESAPRQAMRIEVPMAADPVLETPQAFVTAAPVPMPKHMAATTAVVTEIAAPVYVVEVPLEEAVEQIVAESLAPTEDAPVEAEIAVVIADDPQIFSQPAPMTTPEQVSQPAQDQPSQPAISLPDTSVPMQSAPQPAAQQAVIPASPERSTEFSPKQAFPRPVVEAGSDSRRPVEKAPLAFGLRLTPQAEEAVPVARAVAPQTDSQVPSHIQAPEPQPQAAFSKLVVQAVTAPAQPEEQTQPEAVNIGTGERRQVESSRPVQVSRPVVQQAPIATTAQVVKGASAEPQVDESQVAEPEIAEPTTADSQTKDQDGREPQQQDKSARPEVQFESRFETVRSTRHFETASPAGSIETQRFSAAVAPVNRPIADAVSALRSAENIAIARPVVSASSTPAQEIAVRVARPDAAPIDVHFTQRRGEIQVAVRTVDTELQSNLRQELNTLVDSLEKSGYRTEAVVPRESAPQVRSVSFTGLETNAFTSQLSSQPIGQQSGQQTGHQGRDSESGAQPGSRQQQQQNQQQHNQQQQRRAPWTRWQETLEQTPWS